LSGTRKHQVLADGFVLTEGPRWRDGLLWFSDMFRGEVWTLDLRGCKTLIAKFDDHTAGLGFMSDGSLLVVLQQSQKLMRVSQGKSVEHADLRPLGGHHLNDMVVDHAGRAYVDMRMKRVDLVAPAPDPLEGRADVLVMVEPSGNYRVVARDLLTPNGLAITPDGLSLIVAETRGCRLVQFKIDSDNGALSEPKVFAELGDLRPDGICIDVEGGVWVGSPNKCEFVRVRAGAGIVQSIAVPGKFAVACALGGDDRKTLFMLTAITSWEKVARGDSLGFVETIAVDIAGAGLP